MGNLSVSEAERLLFSPMLICALLFVPSFFVAGPFGLKNTRRTIISCAEVGGWLDMQVASFRLHCICNVCLLLLLSQLKSIMLRT